MLHLPISLATALATGAAATATLAALAALASAAACVGRHRLGRLSFCDGQRSSTHLRRAGHHGLRSAVLQSNWRAALALLGPGLRRERREKRPMDLSRQRAQHDRGQ